jgi:hypothetical protein
MTSLRDNMLRAINALDHLPPQPLPPVFVPQSLFDRAVAELPGFAELAARGEYAPTPRIA